MLSQNNNNGNSNGGDANSVTPMQGIAGAT